MTVRVADGVILLEGHCPVEDAEPLLVALRETAAPRVDLSHVGQLHMAVAQLLLAVRPLVLVPPSERFIGDLTLSALIQDVEDVSATL